MRKFLILIFCLISILSGAAEAGDFSLNFYSVLYKDFPFAAEGGSEIIEVRIVVRTSITLPEFNPAFSSPEKAQFFKDNFARFSFLHRFFSIAFLENFWNSQGTDDGLDGGMVEITGGNNLKIDSAGWVIRGNIGIRFCGQTAVFQNVAESSDEFFKKIIKKVEECLKEKIKKIQNGGGGEKEYYL